MRLNESSINSVQDVGFRSIVNITRWTYICDKVETRGNKEEEREEWELRIQQMLFVICRVQA